MYKTVIYKLEGVLLDDAILQFKYYELLWFYLRRQEAYREFESVLREREKLARTHKVSRPYLTIARQHLSRSDFERYQQEVNILSRRYYHYFVRLIPGMKEVVRVSGYYYQNVLFAQQPFFLEVALRRYSLRLYFRQAQAGFRTSDPSTLEAILNKILEKTRTPARQAILISNSQIPEIAVANRMGLFTIQTRFRASSMGLSFREYRQKLYLKSLEKFPEGLPAPGLFQRLSARPGAVVHSPEELAQKLQELASKPQTAEPTPTQPESETKERPKTIWELIKEALEEELADEKV